MGKGEGVVNVQGLLYLGLGGIEGWRFYICMRKAQGIVGGFASREPFYILAVDGDRLSGLPLHGICLYHSSVGLDLAVIKVYNCLVTLYGLGRLLSQKLCSGLF